MPTNNRAKVEFHRVLTPSSHRRPQYFLNEDDKNENNHRRSSAAWLPPINCACVCSFFGGLCLITLLTMAICIPILISAMTSANRMTSTSTNLVTTASNVATTTTVTGVTTAATTMGTVATTAGPTTVIGVTTATTTTGTIATNAGSTTVIAATTVVTAIVATTANTGTTTTPSCSNPSLTGQILNVASASAPSTYTLYTYGFTATASSATLTFAMTSDAGGPGNHYWLLDSISVNHTVANTNVLVNGGFETGNATGWTQYCNTSANCGTSYWGKLTTSSCYSGTYCFTDDCEGYDYLIQSFPTVIGHYYLISYYLKIFAPGGPYQIYVMLT